MFVCVCAYVCDIACDILSHTQIRDIGSELDSYVFAVGRID